MLKTIALGIKELLKHFKQGNNGVHFVLSFLNYIKFFKLKKKYIYIYIFRMLVLKKKHEEHLLALQGKQLKPTKVK